MNNKINENYFNLTSEVIRGAIERSKHQGEKEINRKFADSRIIDLFSDTTDNFCESKLRLIILEANK